jgi:hypothetical protein
MQFFLTLRKRFDSITASNITPNVLREIREKVDLTVGQILYK